MEMFKQYHFYQLFDPNGPRVFGYNVHRSLNVASFAFVLAVNVFSALSYFTDYKNAVNEVDSLLINFTYCINAVTFLKITVFLQKADVVWDLFDFTRLDFLTSGRCREYVAIMRGHRDTAIKLINYFLNYTSGVLFLWCVVPLAYNALTTSDDPDHRNQNVFNLMYPVPAPVFNRYFPVFYTMELAMAVFLTYNAILIDIFIVLICVTVTSQYEVLGTAFASIGHHVDESTGHHGDDGYKNISVRAYDIFVSILHDQILVYEKLKSFYSMIWIIVVSLIFVNSITLIILTYSFIVVFMTGKSLAIHSLIKFSSADIIFTLEIFLYCYFLNAVNEKKNSVNFGMYSCDWTKMDPKFKNILLMAMRMNNANQLTIKTSPTRIINLHFFANVISTTYNIVSVMLHRTSRNTK